MDILEPILALAVVANLAPILPVVLSTVQSVPRPRRQSKLRSALLAGNLTALTFALAGGLVLSLMQVEMDDLRVAGGLILLVFAIYDLLFSREQRKEPLSEIAEEQDTVGLVPLGIPLMIGPASLTTVLVLAETYGTLTTIFAIGVNAGLNLLLLRYADRFVDRFGHGAMSAAGKVFGLLLAAVAVSMIRTGLANIWQELAAS